jgi:hypothetical protein
MITSSQSLEVPFPQSKDFPVHCTHPLEVKGEKFNFSSPPAQIKRIRAKSLDSQAVGLQTSLPSPTETWPGRLIKIQISSTKELKFFYRSRSDFLSIRVSLELRNTFLGKDNLQIHLLH